MRLGRPVEGLLRGEGTPTNRAEHHRTWWVEAWTQEELRRASVPDGNQDDQGRLHPRTAGVPARPAKLEHMVVRCAVMLHQHWSYVDGLGVLGSGGVGFGVWGAGACSGTLGGVAGGCCCMLDSPAVPQSCHRHHHHHHHRRPRPPPRCHCSQPAPLQLQLRCCGRGGP